MWMYEADDEDFTSGAFPSFTLGTAADPRLDATRLDYFVLDKFKALLERGKTDPLLDERLRARHTVFFLHLLGLDTTGHGYGPHSKVSSGSFEGRTDGTLMSCVGRNMFIIFKWSTGSSRMWRGSCGSTTGTIERPTCSRKSDLGFQHTS